MIFRKFLIACFFVLASFVTGWGQCLSNYPPHYYYVTDSMDYTPGSLRQQILNANADGTGGLICNALMPNPDIATIHLQAPLPVITVDSLSVLDQNAPWPTVTIDGGNLVQEPAIQFALSAPNSCFNQYWWNTLVNFLPGTMYVTNTNDGGVGSLRQAIINSNFSDTKDNIFFNIAGPAPHKINLTSQLEEIKYSVTIDASTQPANGYTGNAPKIELDGASTIAVAFYFYNWPNPSFDIYGFYIHNFYAQGISASYSSINSNIGSLLKPNVISGNGYGISIGDAVNVNIVGNLIGTDTSGNLSEGNGDDGIFILNCQNATISNNIICSNGSDGIYSSTGNMNTVIKSNKIGLAKNGIDPLPNNFGIRDVNLTGTMIGGATAADANIIAHNNVGCSIDGDRTSVLCNSFYNNTTAGIQLVFFANDAILPPEIQKADYDTIRGTARACSRIELFYNTDPPLLAQGKTFIAAVVADSLGNWEYVGSINDPCSVTTTQTDSGRTSEFSIVSGLRAHLIEDTILCPAESITLDAGPGFESYSWNTADTTQTINISSSGIYAVQTVSPGTHCVSSDTVQILLIPGVSLIADTLICNTQSITLDAGTGFASYQWQDSSNSQFFLAYDSTGSQDTVIYFVNVIDTLGCASTDSVTIIFDECLYLSSINSEESLKIFPNPFYHNVNIEPAISSDEIINIRIMDGIGRVVFSKLTTLRKQEIDLSFLSDGIYTVRVNSKNTFRTIKLVKCNN